MPRWIDLVAAAVLAFAAPAGAQDFGAGMPRAASDWLAGKAALPKAPVSAWRPGGTKPADAQRQRSARPPVRRPGQTLTDRWPVATSAAVPRVGITRLAEGNLDTRGAMTAAAAGLPGDLWGPASATELTAAIGAAQPRLQAGRALLVRMLVAQLAPPTGSGPQDEGRLFLARVDRLIALGLLDDARGLLQSAGGANADTFARSFDLAMYAGDAGGACAQMAQRPGLAPNLAARVYCLARAGDWSAAALTLRGARDERLIPPETLALLERFLDDSSADLSEALPGPRTVTPLEFRLFEAIGQPLATGDLPVAFAFADLAPDAGWKAQIEAAERLSRAGAIDPARLASAYVDQKPAASGGVWDRAALYQRLDAALGNGDGPALASALTAAEPVFARAGLLSVLARLIAPRLPGSELDGPAAEAAAHLRLLAGVPVPGAPRLPDADRALVALADGAGDGTAAHAAADTDGAAANGAATPGATGAPAAAARDAAAETAGGTPSPAAAAATSASGAADDPGGAARDAAAEAAGGTPPPAAAAATPASGAADDPSGAQPDFPAGSPGALYAEALHAPAQPQPPAEGRGLALLRALADVDAGLDGDVQRAAGGLRRLTELGQPGTARSATLELLLTEHLGLRR